MPLDKEKHSLYHSPLPPLPLYEEIIDVYFKRNGLLVHIETGSAIHRYTQGEHFKLVCFDWLNRTTLYLWYVGWVGRLLLPCASYSAQLIIYKAVVSLEPTDTGLVPRTEALCIPLSSTLSCAIPTRNPVSFSFNFRH